MVPCSDTQSLFQGLLPGRHGVVPFVKVLNLELPRMNSVVAAVQRFAKVLTR